jgi:SNF2 family DNA or RNA helicase
LLEMYSKGVSSILADDPGCGKTLQTLVLLSILLDMERQNPGQDEIDSFAPVLIVCPLSVVSQWESEIQRFTPFIRSLMYIGSKEEREGLQLKNSFRSDTPFHPPHPRVVVRGPDGKRLETRKPNTWDVLITHYSTILSDADVLSSIAWRFIVIDEAHRLKNSESRLYKCLKERFWLREGRISLLTGTPMQNNTSELWSLLHFLHPQVFMDRDAFVTCFPSDQAMMHSPRMEVEKEEDDAQTSSPEYHEVLRPFILRRLKSVVLKDELPDRKEFVLKSSLSPVQMDLYRKILMRDPEAFEKGVRLSNGNKQYSSKHQYSRHLDG